MHFWSSSMQAIDNWSWKRLASGWLRPKVNVQVIRTIHNKPTGTISSNTVLVAFQCLWKDWSSRQSAPMGMLTSRSRSRLRKMWMCSNEFWTMRHMIDMTGINCYVSCCITSSFISLIQTNHDSQERIFLTSNILGIRRLITRKDNRQMPTTMAPIKPSNIIYCRV
jgi:hypothetical protein